LLFVLGVSALDRVVKARKDASHFKRQHTHFRRQSKVAHLKSKDAAHLKSHTKDAHFKTQISKIKKAHQHQHHDARNYMKQSDECPTLSYSDWKELGSFRPSNDLIHGFWGDTMGTIFYQPITDGWGDVNLDLYEVEITTLPTDQSSALAFFNYWRLDIAKGDDTQFVDTDDCSFKAFDSGEGSRWASDNPVKTYITIHLARLLASLTSFSFDDGSVMCTQFSSGETQAYWTFSVIHSFRDGGHPVSGNRRFGFYTTQDGKSIFYTKGVDRVTTIIDRLASAAGQVFENADKTWVSLQDKLVDYVNSHGGAATKRPRTSARCDWDDVWGSWTESCDSRGVIQIDGDCHRTTTLMCGSDGECESDGSCSSPAGCVCGSVECYCGRPPQTGKICDPWR